MSEHKKTFQEWWAGLQQETRFRDHVVRGVLADEGFKQVSGSPDGLASEWERSAGRAPDLPEPDLLCVALSREAQAWMLCHLIAEIGRLQTEIANIETRKLRHPTLATVNGIAGPAASLREIALSDDARLAREVLQALNDAINLK